MSYIVPSELPKSCSSCPYCYLIMQNPLSSKTPIKRYRCQVGKAPWRTFDVDFYDEEYKDKDCPLVPMERIVEKLEESLNREDKLWAEAVYDFQKAEHFDKQVGLNEAIQIIEEECVLNE